MSFINLVFLSLGCLLGVGCNSGRKSTLELVGGTYNGDFNHIDQKHGFGIYKWPDGSIFNGNFINDLRHGDGRFLWSNGDSYEGEYQEDHRSGKGSYTWADSAHYEGDFLSGKRHGYGVFRSSSGSTYEGQWLNDRQHGKGTLTLENGAIIEGTWHQGVLLNDPVILPPTLNKHEKSDQVASDVSAVPPPSSSEFKAKDSFEALDSSSSKEQPYSESTEATHHKSSQLNVSLPDLEGGDISTAEEKRMPSIKNTSTKGFDADAESDTTMPTWEGTVSEAEIFFIRDLVDGIDTIQYRTTEIPFSGSMRIVNDQGQPQGEVNLLNGRLHGEEIFFDVNGEVAERNFWANGRPIGQ